MRDKRKEKILKEINLLAVKLGREVKLMEVCGSHTQAIWRYGIRGLLPANVKLTTGPGCPVCVTAQEDIDLIVFLARAGIPVASYGDVLRVPGLYGSLEEAKKEGAKVFAVYSIEEALTLKKTLPDLVFFGLGFDTTAPMTAYAIKKGLTVFSTHKLFLPAMTALLEMGEVKIDGFINPGHVSTIIGIAPYKKLKVPQVITGFTEEDVLVGIYLLLKQLAEGRSEVENEYLRSVKPDGNPAARNLIFEVFKITDGLWRGFGKIPGSGLAIKSKYKNQDARYKYKNILKKFVFKEHNQVKACRCSEIIRGLSQPDACPLFRRVCSPENPFGPCMVSVEGACNLEYRYQDKL